MSRNVLIVVMAAVGLLLVLDGGRRAGEAAAVGHEPPTPPAPPPSPTPAPRKRGRPRKAKKASTPPTEPVAGSEPLEAPPAAPEGDA